MHLFSQQVLYRTTNSLHGARATGQEVLNVHCHCLCEVGHAPKATTGGAVVQKPAHPGGWILLQDVLLSSQVPLEVQKTLARTKQEKTLPF